MPTLNEVKTWKGRGVLGPDGEKIGSIDDVYLDRRTGEPEWAAVKTGLFGGKIHFVPLAGSSADEDHLNIPYSKSKVKAAPDIAADGQLSPEEEQRLYAFYGGGDYDDWDRDASDPETDTPVGRAEAWDEDAPTVGDEPAEPQPTRPGDAS